MLATALLTLTLTLLTFAPSTSAHGFVQYIDSPSSPPPSPTHYLGYDPGFRFQPTPPSVPGWYADNPDIGFVSPQQFHHPDIVCHRSARAAQDYVVVRAGANITLTWLTWPESHVGPIMDYLAPCPAGGCAGIPDDEKDEALRFVKVAQRGLKAGVTPATNWLEAWVVDDFIKGGFKWDFHVPGDLKTGLYVLRHEILALHSAWDKLGVQAYPQCISLNVTDGGETEITGGVPATSFYDAEDPGVHINVYGGLTEYPFPGPALWR